MKNTVLERVETETGHWYRNPSTGLQVSGVTTILKALPKGALEIWKLKKAVNAAIKGKAPEGVEPIGWYIDAGDREAFAAAAVGTGAHNFAEAHMLGEDPALEDLTEKERPHAECYLQFVRDYQPEPVLVEKVVVYIDPKTGTPLYAGTIDLIAKLTWNIDSDYSRLPNNWVDGLTWLCDYKASSSQARPSHALQAAAYRYATHWLDTGTNELHEMPPVDKTAVILLNGGKGGSCYRAFELDSSPVVFSVFKSLLRIHNFVKVEDRIILGEL